MLESFTTLDNGHGRIEKRICQKIVDISWLQGLNEWVGLQAVFAVRRIVQTKHKSTDETSYYITSTNTSPENLLRTVREHWKIESMHWILDVVFSEDDCCIISENGANFKYLPQACAVAP